MDDLIKMFHGEVKPPGWTLVGFSGSLVDLKTDEIKARGQNSVELRRNLNFWLALTGLNHPKGVLLLVDKSDNGPNMNS